MYVRNEMICITMCMFACMNICRYYCMYVLGRLAAGPVTLVAFANPAGRANQLIPAKAALKEQDTKIDVRAAE